MIDLEFEKRVQNLAGQVEYPPTPNVSGAVAARLRDSRRPRFNRRLAWSLVAVFAFLTSLMLIPPVRAAVLEFIQIGIVRIFPRPAEPTLDSAPPEPAAIDSPTMAAPSPAVSPLPTLFVDLAGRTTLQNARQIAGYPILVPTHPPEIGPPDLVYVQDVEEVMTILVWMDEQDPGRVSMSLHFLPSRSWAVKKFEPVVIEETRVNGQQAIWTEGPYPLILQNGYIDYMRLVEGHVLIWAVGDVTYRLETDLALEEAVRIAESLAPLP